LLATGCLYFDCCEQLSDSGQHNEHRQIAIRTGMVLVIIAEAIQVVIFPHLWLMPKSKMSSAGDKEASFAKNGGRNSQCHPHAAPKPNEIHDFGWVLDFSACLNQKSPTTSRKVLSNLSEPWPQ
jgi:hypothetical protein